MSHNKGWGSAGLTCRKRGLLGNSQRDGEKGKRRQKQLPHGILQETTGARTKGIQERTRVNVSGYGQVRVRFSGSMRVQP